MGPYIADFACHAAKLVIEVDGGQHGTDQARAADARRSAWFDGQGYRVLRVWNTDVLQNLDGVMQLIDTALQAGKER